MLHFRSNVVSYEVKIEILVLEDFTAESTFVEAFLTLNKTICAGNKVVCSIKYHCLLSSFHELLLDAAAATQAP